MRKITKKYMKKMNYRCLCVVEKPKNDKKKLIETLLNDTNKDE